MLIESAVLQVMGMTCNVSNNSLPDAYVSVVIPVYNCEKYIETAVNSVLNQSFSDFEIIIVNDASTDGTSGILQRLQRKDSRIRVIDQKKNLGVAETRNKAFEYCRGKFIALLDADDFWFEDKLKEQLDVQEKTNADLVYCSYAIVDDHGERICDDFIVPETTDLKSSLVQSAINCSTALFKAELASEFRFRPDYYHEDLVFWIDLLRSGIKVRGVKNVLAAYRLVQGSRAADKFRSAGNRYLVLRKYLHLPLPDTYLIMTKYAIKSLIKYKRNVKRQP